MEIFLCFYSWIRRVKQKLKTSRIHWIPVFISSSRKLKVLRIIYIWDLNIKQTLFSSQLSIRLNYIYIPLTSLPGLIYWLIDWWSVYIRSFLLNDWLSSTKRITAVKPFILNTGCPIIFLLITGCPTIL